MTLDDVRIAIQTNNAYFITRLNAITTWLNTELNDIIVNHKDNIDNIYDLLLNLNTKIEAINTDLANNITASNTKLENDISTLNETVNNHTDDGVVHVTQNDKDLWNATLKNAKDYAKSLFDQVNSFDIVKCTELPSDTSDINEHTIYFLQIDQEQDDFYEEYMFLNGEWEKIGNTRIDLSDYVTKSMLQDKIDAINQTIQSLTTSTSQDKSSLQNSINSLQNALNTTNNTLLALSNTVSNNNTTLTQAITTANNNIAQLQQTINNINTDITSALENTKSSLEQQINAIKNDLLNNYKPYVHQHQNKSVIDKFSADSDGNLLYNNDRLTEDFSEVDVVDLMIYLWNEILTSNLVDKDEEILITSDGFILEGSEEDG